MRQESYATTREILANIEERRKEERLQYLIGVWTIQICESLASTFPNLPDGYEIVVYEQLNNIAHNTDHG